MNTLLNQDPAGIKQVCLTDCKNTLEEFMAVVRYHAELIFSPEFCENIRANRRLIDRFLAENRAIYGAFAKNLIPRSYLVDKTGKVVYATKGYSDEEFAELMKRIEAALK